MKKGRCEYVYDPPDCAAVQCPYDANESVEGEKLCYRHAAEKRRMLKAKADQERRETALAFVGNTIPTSTLQRLAEAGGLEALIEGQMALASALQSVEWAGGKPYSGYGPIMPCCPSCQGIRPGYAPLGPDSLGHWHGHTKKCGLAKALKAAELWRDQESKPC